MFVDFDNVYTGLMALDPAAAKRFAEDPKHWTEALADGGTGAESRRFLIRNCYLNPVIYSKYRPYWTRAGFRVIDCPSLTQRGKSSTDINLVLDAMDALSGAAHVEEFFVASADADFTSLVQRFRAADRMTTVIAAGAVAFAYREMADSVVESHDFVAILNGTSAEIPRMVPSAGLAAPLRTAPGVSVAATTAADEVRALVQAAPGPVTGAVAAHRALTADPSLKTDWGGHGKFGAWIAQIGQGVQYSSTPSPGWVWDAKRFSPELSSLASEGRPAIEEQVTRVTDVPALSADQFRQVFVSLEAKLREHPGNRSELARVRPGRLCGGRTAGVPLGRQLRDPGRGVRRRFPLRRHDRQGPRRRVGQKRRRALPARPHGVRRRREARAQALGRRRAAGVGPGQFPDLRLRPTHQDPRLLSFSCASLQQEPLPRLQ